MTLNEGLSATKTSGENEKFLDEKQGFYTPKLLHCAHSDSSYSCPVMMYLCLFLCPAQPRPAAAPPAEASQEAAGFKRPTCPRCGLTVPDHRLPPLPPGLSRLQGSSLSVHSSSSRRSKRSRGSVAGSHQPAATPTGRQNNVSHFHTV